MPLSTPNDASTPRAKVTPWSAIFFRSEPACWTKPMIFRPMTGKHAGHQVEDQPAQQHAAEDGQELGEWQRNGCGFGGRWAAEIGVSGTATGFGPMSTPENESPCGISLSIASLVARCSRISQASPSRWIEPPELADCTNGWSGTKSVGSFSRAPAGFHAEQDVVAVRGGGEFPAGGLGGLAGAGFCEQRRGGGILFQLPPPPAG